VAVDYEDPRKKGKIGKFCSGKIRTKETTGGRKKKGLRLISCSFPKGAPRPGQFRKEGPEKGEKKRTKKHHRKLLWEGVFPLLEEGLTLGGEKGRKEVKQGEAIMISESSEHTLRVRDREEGKTPCGLF